jgi:hypothetical protein
MGSTHTLTERPAIDRRGTLKLVLPVGLASPIRSPAIRTTTGQSVLLSTATSKGPARPSSVSTDAHATHNTVATAPSRPAARLAGRLTGFRRLSINATP